ncbi:hypothetical protein [Bifidobacterium crudilactis]|jgi:hypothetical protein|uniref:hypothetical protein n=1 Tax=Bifidobacterium crudilactis TaxID=327277 RepID=UPI002354173B|nr:hypothetical protein [Bifidobacterium crudilactis]MCI1218517.1 hypothetical protein [Bifidobacterium crudilactis]
MKHLHVIAADIDPDLYAQIAEGSRFWEVRDEPFDPWGANVPALMEYVSEASGRLLGSWWLRAFDDRVCAVDADGRLDWRAQRCLSQWALPEDSFRERFGLRNPGDSVYLYSAVITGRASGWKELG